MSLSSVPPFRNNMDFKKRMEKDQSESGVHRNRKEEKYFMLL